MANKMNHHDPHDLKVKKKKKNLEIFWIQFGILTWIQYDTTSIFQFGN